MGRNCQIWESKPAALTTVLNFCMSQTRWRIEGKLFDNLQAFWPILCTLPQDHLHQNHRLSSHHQPKLHKKQSVLPLPLLLACHPGK